MGCFSWCKASSSQPSTKTRISLGHLTIAVEKQDAEIIKRSWIVDYDNPDACPLMLLANGDNRFDDQVLGLIVACPETRNCLLSPPCFSTKRTVETATQHALLQRPPIDAGEQTFVDRMSLSVVDLSAKQTKTVNLLELLVEYDYYLTLEALASLCSLNNDMHRVRTFVTPKLLFESVCKTFMFSREQPQQQQRVVAALSKLATPQTLESFCETTWCYRIGRSFEVHQKMGKQLLSELTFENCH